MPHQNGIAACSLYLSEASSHPAGNTSFIDQFCSYAQVALERLAIVEKQRQSAVEELQALHTGPRVGSPVMAPGPGRSALQAALDKARADSEAAQFRANEAEAALAALTIEQQSRQVGVLRLP